MLTSLFTRVVIIKGISPLSSGSTTTAVIAPLPEITAHVFTTDVTNHTTISGIYETTSSSWICTIFNVSALIRATSSAHKLILEWQALLNIPEKLIKLIPMELLSASTVSSSGTIDTLQTISTVIRSQVNINPDIGMLIIYHTLWL